MMKNIFLFLFIINIITISGHEQSVGEYVDYIYQLEKKIVEHENNLEKLKLITSSMMKDFKFNAKRPYQWYDFTQKSVYAKEYDQLTKSSDHFLYESHDFCLSTVDYFVNYDRQCKNRDDRVFLQVQRQINDTCLDEFLLKILHLNKKISTLNFLCSEINNIINDGLQLHLESSLVEFAMICAKKINHCLNVTDPRYDDLTKTCAETSNNTMMNIIYQYLPADYFVFLVFIFLSFVFIGTLNKFDKHFHCVKELNYVPANNGMAQTITTPVIPPVTTQQWVIQTTRTNLSRRYVSHQQDR